jgi:hypothetical protein
MRAHLGCAGATTAMRGGFVVGLGYTSSVTARCDRVTLASAFAHITTMALFSMSVPKPLHAPGVSPVREEKRQADMTVHSTRAESE